MCPMVEWCFRKWKKGCARATNGRKRRQLGEGRDLERLEVGGGFMAQLGEDGGTFALILSVLEVRLWHLDGCCSASVRF